jgi:hypothetical protein
MTLPLAQSGITFLIYLVAGVLWLLGNISQQKKAKQRAEEMRRRREEREREESATGKKQPKPHPLEDDLETFLGRLSGEAFTKAEPDKSAPPPLPDSASAPAKKAPSRPEPARPAGQPVAKPAKQPKTNIGAMAMADSYQEMEDIQDALEISYEQLKDKVHGQTLKSVRQVMVDLSPSLIHFPRIPVQRIQAKEANTTPPALKRRSEFKKGLVASAILGPPAALQEPGSHER